MNLNNVAIKIKNLLFIRNVKFNNITLIISLKIWDLKIITTKGNPNFINHYNKTFIRHHLR